MIISIKEATDLGTKILTKTGFSEEEAQYCIENCLEGELTNKKTHGFIRIPVLIEKVQQGKIIVGGKDIFIEKETPVSILVNGQKKPGLYVINKALELGLNKVKESGIVAVGVTNTAPISGLIGQYARKATENNIIFIGFNNSPGGLVPFSSIKEIFGTNPFTVGIPTNGIPLILDMSSSKITWGHLLLAKAEGKEIPDNVAIDKDGNPTNSPEASMEGGLLPIADHKGSGIAFIVEILGGALTTSRCGYNIKGGWGSFFILIDPTIFRSIKDFKADVESLINEVKNSPKQKGVKEIFYPGEQSQKLRQACLKSGKLELNDKLYEELKLLLG
ncbi:Ldh family oxidoreductase [Candidatus Dojkabacteria bacterium]|nr:Ldh family oxidoreductase [Candidatus Dojkabacteria bacterium]